MIFGCFADDFVKDDDLKEVFRDEDISPEGLIEEDYEQELGAPAQVEQYYNLHLSLVMLVKT